MDFSNLNCSKPDQEKIALDAIADVKSIVENLNDKVLFLTNAIDALPNSKTIGALREVASFVSKKKLAGKECVVGITGIKKSLLTSMNMLTSTKNVPFDTLDQAKEYLVSD